MNNQVQDLPFSIAYVSSQTEQNPATKLINAGPYSEGWISIPNTRFPQELVLDFGCTVAITELTFISHQNKIASSVVILSGKDASIFQKTKFQQLDTFQFSDNRQRNYKARESQTCHLPSVRLRYLKLIIDGCYQNKLNKGNQIGIVSIVSRGFQDDINADDPELALLEKQKREAQASENYLLCHQIKQKIDNIINNRAMLNELNQQKDEAVRQQNYLFAEQIKKKIERIVSGANLDSPPPAPMPNRRQRQSLQEVPPRERDLPRRRSSVPPENQYPPDMNDPMMDYDQFNPPGMYQGPGIGPQSSQGMGYPPMNPPFPGDQGNFPANNPNFQDNYQDAPSFNTNNNFNTNFNNYVDDDRPIRPGKNNEYNFDENNAYPNDELIPPSNHRQRNSDDRPIRQSHQDDLIEVNEDEGNDKNDPPEDLTDQANRKEAEIFIGYGHEDEVKYFYSKNVQNRIKGMRDLADIVKSANSNVQQQLYTKYCHMMKNRVKENIPKIFCPALDELMSLTDSIRVPFDCIKQAIDVHIPTVVNKMSKEQLSQSAIEFIRWAAIKKQALGIPLVISHLTTQNKGPTYWGNIEIRLKLLNEFLEKLKDPSFEYNPVINYVFFTLSSPKIEIRNASCQVLKTLALKGQAPTINKMLQSSNLSTQTQKMAKNAISSH